MAPALRREERGTSGECRGGCIWRMDGVRGPGTEGVLILPLWLSRAWAGPLFSSRCTLYLLGELWVGGCVAVCRDVEGLCGCLSDVGRVGGHEVLGLTASLEHICSRPFTGLTWAVEGLQRTI